MATGKLGKVISCFQALLLRYMYLFVASRICPTRRSGAPPIPWNAGRRGGPRLANETRLFPTTAILNIPRFDYYDDDFDYDDDDDGDGEVVNTRRRNRNRNRNRNNDADDNNNIEVDNSNTNSR